MAVLYQPQYRVHGTTTWSNWGSPISTTSTTIGQNPPGPALAASTQYDFQVIASNSFGSTPSAIISATTSAGVSINSIALSPQTFTAGGAQGTIVGSITVTMSSGTFTGSLSVTGTDASFFQISGGNLVLSGTTTTARAYSINIVATQSGISNSPLTQNFPNIQATAASQESAEGFTVTTVGPIMFASTSAGFAQSTGPWNQFALVNTGTGRDPQISLNTSVQTDTGFIAELIYHNHTAYQENTSQGWWRWDTGTSTWIEFGVSTVALSASTYSLNAPANTLIGTISVAMLDGSTFSGTLAVNDTTHFKIVGSQLQAASTLTATSYAIIITAVPAVSGATKIGEQGTFSTTVAVAGTLSAPAQAANAGLTRLAFNSDFVSTSEVTSDTSIGSGFKWYPGLNHDTTYTVNTTATAASINNGNVGGGSNASPSGGVLTLLSQNSGWSGLFTTLPVWTLNFNGAVLPPVGQGHWGPHAYFEAYLQFVNNGNTGDVNSGATGGPAFWSWAAQDLAGYGMGSSSISQNPHAEVDFMEHFGTMFGGSSLWQSSIVPWGISGADSYASGTTDSNWHTFGVLWKSTGGGTGSLTCYFDNVLQGSVGTFTAMESESLFMVLGTGNNNWHMNIDWARVWTA